MSRNHITAAYFGEQMFSTLVVVGTLQGNEFGIDLSEYEVGVDFRGVHRIPEGVHYVYATSCDAQGHRGSRTGFVHYFLKNEIVVCEWDMHTEELKLGADVSKAVLENIANAERYSEIEALLLKYNSDEYDTWKTLTNHITSDLLRRIVPTCSIITSAEPVTCSKNASQEQTRENEPCNQHGIVLVAESEQLTSSVDVSNHTFSFTNVPARSGKDLSAADITANYMDSIRVINKLMSTNGENQILGEFQLSFILFFCGHSIDCLQQWRTLFALLCNSELAVISYGQFYSKLMILLMYHIPMLPLEMVGNIETNTIYKDTRKLLRNTCQTKRASDMQRLLVSLQQTVHWDFPGLLEEDPEDLPTVVTL
ncbi:protein AAR2 homolog [Anopheles bellator]|uniref:protein AAR2 homolog n=1 Tax=Anopheles bellator TaxID=139047 RepID=UPI0026495378|nr:protein AAR2 homolog [Anopheles bellator]